MADRVGKPSEARYLLSSCGESLQLSDEVTAKMTQFVLTYVYSDTKGVTSAAAKASKWKGQKRKSLTRMIPDTDSLLHHLRRVNYSSYLQK